MPQHPAESGPCSCCGLQVPIVVHFFGEELDLAVECRFCPQCDRLVAADWTR